MMQTRFVLFTLFLFLSFHAGPETNDKHLPRYQVGDLELVITIVPRTVRLGNNKLLIKVFDDQGRPVHDLEIEAYAEMAAMGTMPAMRAPADLRQTSPGVYEGSVNLSMRGEWPLTVTFRDGTRGDRRLRFDLATDREGLVVVSGAVLSGQSTDRWQDGAVITIDNKRRQMIGVETGLATHRNLVKKIRAVGEVTYDERLLSSVTLKFDGFIGELKADYVGAEIQQDQVLFTVYGPDLLAAQEEYLATIERRLTKNQDSQLRQAARQRLQLWDMAIADIEALERRGSPHAYIPVYSPRKGILIERNIKAGSAAFRGRNLLTIADLSRVWIKANVFEADLELIHVGMSATVTLPYLQNRTYTATIEHIYPYLQGQSRTSQVRLSLDNQSGELKPAMYAEVSLSIDLGHKLSVPEQAIIIAGKSRVVFVDLGRGRLRPVRIKTGRRANGLVEVLEGLSLDDIVVTSGNFLVAAEARLKLGIEKW